MEDAVPFSQIGARQAQTVKHLVGQVLRELVAQKAQDFGAKGFFFRGEVKIHEWFSQ
jgi:hypothetical protein